MHVKSSVSAFISRNRKTAESSRDSFSSFSIVRPFLVRLHLYNFFAGICAGTLTFICTDSTYIERNVKDFRIFWHL